MRLTLDQRVKRNTKMRNKKIKKELPLLAASNAIPGDWLRNEDQELAHLQQQAKRFEQWWEGILAHEKQNQQLAERCQAEVHELATEEQYAELERRASYTDHCGPDYKLDFWRRELARIDPRYCAHAENKHSIFRAGEICPVCLSVTQK